MRSIERYLLAWIMGALTLGSALVAIVTYVVTLEEMNEVFDADLKNVAEAVASYLHSERGADGHKSQATLRQRSDMPDEYEIVTVTWTRAGGRIYSSDPRVAVPFSDAEGLSHPVIAGQPWIVYTTVRSNGVAQAAQPLASRQEMAGESAAKVFPPMLVLVVMVGGLLVFGLRRGLRPLDGAARDVAARSVKSLDPIPTGDVPREITPLVTSINDLMSRLAAAFSAQRRFLADAAHELRTPVTALRLQAQLLKRSADGASRDEALAELEAGIDRSQHLVEQLLQIARSEPDGEAMRSEPVDLGGLVRSVVGAASARADHLGIDLGAQGRSGIVVDGDGNQLTVLLNNLVENALRYTPEGGVVDVEAGTHGGRPMLRVVDNGPGIAEAERGRVFDRFYRCEEAQGQARDAGGSGLGLAIVRAIAERHGARVSLHTPDSGRGLEVRVEFAAPQA